MEQLRIFYISLMEQVAEQLRHVPQGVILAPDKGVITSQHQNTLSQIFDLCEKAVLEIDVVINPLENLKRNVAATKLPKDSGTWNPDHVADQSIVFEDEFRNAITKALSEQIPMEFIQPEKITNAILASGDSNKHPFVVLEGRGVPGGFCGCFPPELIAYLEKEGYFVKEDKSE